MPESDRQGESFRLLMDELDILALVVEDIEDPEMHERVTMWIDYMVYRVLYHEDEDQQPECAPEARECRKLLLRHLDDMAWGEDGATQGQVAWAYA